MWYSYSFLLYSPKKSNKIAFSSATFGDSSGPTLRRLIPCQAWVGISGRCLGLQASQGKDLRTKEICLEEKCLVKPQTFVQSIENHHAEIEKVWFWFVKKIPRITTPTSFTSIAMQLYVWPRPAVFLASMAPTVLAPKARNLPWQKTPPVQTWWRSATLVGVYVTKICNNEHVPCCLVGILVSSWMWSSCKSNVHPVIHFWRPSSNSPHFASWSLMTCCCFETTFPKVSSFSCKKKKRLVSEPVARYDFKTRKKTLVDWYSNHPFFVS